MGSDECLTWTQTEGITGGEHALERCHHCSMQPNGARWKLHRFPAATEQVTRWFYSERQEMSRGLREAGKKF